MKLVSLHLPKTAGTSFGHSLEVFFGRAFLKDYGDKPISKPAHERNKSALLSSIEIEQHGLAKIDCVHGHFLPIKYLLLNTKQNLTFITWLRDPIQRLISHYNYWQTSYKPKTSTPHHKQVIEEKWTFEQFCLSPKFRNIYSQYLWAFPLENFAFIGITEYYQEDLSYFEENYIEGTLSQKRLNVATAKATKCSIEPALLERIKSYHEHDIALYERALSLRQTRCSNGHR